MNDFPSIRFLGNGPNAALNRQVAQYVQDYFDGVKISGMSRGKTELIIVDRSLDPCVLLLHEYTYQALAYDVLEIPICQPPGKAAGPGGEVRVEDSYRYTDEKKEVRNVLLSESDELYVRYRHEHIAAVITGVNEELKKFSKDNAAAQYTKSNKGAARLGDGVDIAQAIRALPQYTEMLTKFITHITMSENCFSILNQTGILRAGILEQDLATGVDKHGKSVQVLKILEELAKLVSDKSGIVMTEKVRLLLLYFSMMDGVQEEDKKKMIRAAGMSLEVEKIIDTFTDLQLIGTHLQSGTGGVGGAASSSLKHVHKIHKNEEMLSFYKKRAKSVHFELSRYEPVMKEVMESAATKRLSRSQYPYLHEPEFGGFVQDARNPSGGGRIRAAQFDWDWDAPEVTPKDDQNITSLAKSSNQPDKARVIIFCLGGVSFSEIRSAYEVTRATNCEVYIGGTSIITTPMLFNILKADVPASGAGI